MSAVPTEIPLEPDERMPPTEIAEGESLEKNSEPVRKSVREVLEEQQRILDLIRT